MKFSYIALNQEHHKLTGVLSAENEQEARAKLHAMSLSVISLKKEKDSALAEGIDDGIVSFVFHVVDMKGNETKGTIDAKDRKSAYYRLVSEYGFKVLSLVDSSFSLEDQEKKGAEGLEQLAEEVEEEYGVIQANPLDQMEGKPSALQSEDFLDAKRELVENVEEIVDRAEMVLKKFQDTLTGDEFRNIKTKIDSLMRLRLSNNLKYIQDLSDELLILVDTTLQQHAEISEEEREEHSFGVLDDDQEAENLEMEKGIVAHVRRVSSKMKRLLKGYKKKRARKKRKKLRIKRAHAERKHTSFIRTRLLYRSLKKIFSSFKRIIFARNAAVRKQHIKNLVSHVKEVHRIIKAPKKRLVAVEEDIENREKEEEDEKEKEKKYETEFHQTSIYYFLQETHLFFGWLLAFYAGYFYFSSFVLVKWGVDSPLFSFLHRSLTSSFPFLVTGCFFILFLGLTLSLKFSHGRVFLSIVHLLVAFFLLGVFLVNF